MVHKQQRVSSSSFIVLLATQQAACVETKHMASEVVASELRRHNDHMETRRDSTGYLGTSRLGW